MQFSAQTHFAESDRPTQCARISQTLGFGWRCSLRNHRPIVAFDKRRTIRVYSLNTPLPTLPLIVLPSIKTQGKYFSCAASRAEQPYLVETVITCCSQYRDIFHMQTAAEIQKTSGKSHSIPLSHHKSY